MVTVMVGAMVVMVRVIFNSSSEDVRYGEHDNGSGGDELF